MTERYNVQASTILGENYKITNIECSDYNPNIDNSITVTITVTDVYGDAISGESVTVTASEGNFTQLNGSDITAASSVTGTTNSSGQFTLTYTCSEWGLITFSANNSSIQCNVKGYKQVYTNNKVTVYSDGKNAEVVFNGSVTSNASEYIIGNVGSYVPLFDTSTNYHSSTSQTYLVSIRANSNVVLYGANGKSLTLNNSINYMLKTPLY